MADKKKYFRFLPLLGGSITLLIAFIASIPLGSSVVISFHMLESSGIYHYIWGIVESGVIWFGYTAITADNVVPLVLWIFLLFSAICGIIGMSYKEKPKSLKKLLLIGGFTVTIEFGYFTTLYFLNFGTYTLGFGYYGLIFIMFLYFLSAGLITDYQKI
ncbi:MAG: hypothetical protein ACTSRE_08910 [Promethearchaeota archaeon]